MLAIALNPFGERSLVGLMKLPAALFTSPVSGPLSSQMRCTIASTAAASRISTAWVLTFPPSDFAVSSRTPPRRPQIQSSAPSSTYLAAISLPRPVPPPVMRMRLPLSSPSLNMRAPWGGSGHSTADALWRSGTNEKAGQRGDEQLVDRLGALAARLGLQGLHVTEVVSHVLPFR